MDRCNSRCRQFTPPGWGTARTLAPCGRSGRCVAFSVGECRPAYGPMIVPRLVGMNTAKDYNVKENPDACHGRNYNSLVKPKPICVELKMCPVPNKNSANNEGGNGCGSGGWQSGGQGQGNYDQIGGSSSSSSDKDPYCEQCPNTCPLPRCPPGVKVERTLPIIPQRRLQESAFKMPSTSIYKSDYVPRAITQTPSFAPERIVAESQGDFEHQSLTKYDYKPHAVCPYKKPPWSFAKPRVENDMKLNGISTYKIDYVPKEANPAPSAKPVPFISADYPAIDDRTVYQVEYIAHPLPSQVTKLTKKQMLAEVTSHCVPFDGLTIYKQDYIPKKGTPAASVIDKDRRFVKVLDPMDGTTTYKAAYNPFYFEDIECIPPEVYDQMYPPKDKCCAVRCYPEAERELEDPVQPPRPPCPPPGEKPYCPTPNEMRCSPRVSLCVSPYKLKKEKNNYEDCTTIRVEHNANRECQNEPIEYVCPQQPCKPSY